MSEQSKENEKEVVETKNVLEKEVVENEVTAEGVTDSSENEDKKDDETIKENENAVSEIESKVAEDAEKEDEVVEEEKIDYTSFSMEELVAELKKVVADNPVQSIKPKVDAIKNAFNPKFGELLAEKKAQFLEEGGESIDFKLNSATKTEYNEVLFDYKKKRDAYYAELESRLKANLEQREAVIETLKTLIDEAEPRTMHGRFKELQERWKTIGPVPRQHYNDTWKIYHHHVERFYDLLHMSNDFRDADFKNNLELKLKVIEKAEALLEESDANDAFKKLQDLHKRWKEDIGPVSREHRETIWQRFSEVSRKINDKKHNYYRELRSKHQEVIEKKMVVIDEILAYDTSKNKNHNDWQKSIKEIQQLRDKFFDAGKLPYRKSEAIWQKFKNATKNFNKERNIFYKQEKSGQQENLNKKKALIALAENLKESEDWETATNTFKKIQADWKKIGHVPRKYSNDVWKQFKDACNFYFDRLHQNKNKLSADQENVIVVKKEFLETLKSTEKVTLEEVKVLISEWSELGVLPRNGRHLEEKFNKQIDSLLKKNNIEKGKVEMLKFTSTINAYLDENDSKKIESEVFFVRKKLEENKKEIQQLENNLSFFSNADTNNPLVKNVVDKIDKLKKELSVWQDKLDYIRKIDY